MKTVIAAFLFLLVSCNSLRGLKKQDFSYAGNKHLSLLVPKKFKKQEFFSDSAGNQAKIYTYSDGAVLYFAYGDSSKQYQYISRSMNIPKQHPGGGWMYKGQDSTQLFWREVNLPGFKFGYWNVSSGREIKFDTAVNHPVWQKKR
ncbi:MAG TPA: hypothetical protein VEZ55_13245 [Chitinophagaceae bacterium]|nr:hypothetical protein [Chitinophagaceae bacterium]